MTTVYRPDGAGPFPIVVINHPRFTGAPRDQERFRPLEAASFFLQRGYAVVVPMRQGFAKSEGWYVGIGCDVARIGIAQADDIVGALDYFRTLPWVDAGRIVVAGQAHGGYATLAFGTLNYPGVKGLINFSGGSRNTECTNWQYSLSQATASYGHASKIPSLWLYADNDSFFGGFYRDMYAAYVAAGGQARLISAGNLPHDGHFLFDTDAGRAVWQPAVSEFLRGLGLPNTPLAQYAKHLLAPPDRPKASGFAALTDVDKVPYLRFFGRSGYRKFLAAEKPRAFAIAEGGEWGYAWGDKALQRALDFCRENAKKRECKLYAVDDDVVW
ncbi:MAG: prolyl oligopeptidase family serine peptidase [Ramlibacter sp.]|nr:prolyl oligopeptidase family serine peptidase [Ramlibacter sp.]